MKLELDKNSERPIYQQIVDQTLEMIRNGQFVDYEAGMMRKIFAFEKAMRPSG